MFEPTLVEKARREWKARRDSLFARYREKASPIRLAVEVKMIDDDIAESAEKTERQRVRNFRTNLCDSDTH
jgi:hypothetical protein